MTLIDFKNTSGSYEKAARDIHVAQAELLLALDELHLRLLRWLRRAEEREQEWTEWHADVARIQAEYTDEREADLLQRIAAKRAEGLVWSEATESFRAVRAAKKEGAKQ